MNLDKSSGFLHSFQWPETFAQRQNFSVAPLGSAAHRAGPPMGFGGPVYGPCDCSKQDFQPFWYMTFAANFYLSYPIQFHLISSLIFFIYLSQYISQLFSQLSIRFHQIFLVPVLQAWQWLQESVQGLGHRWRQATPAGRRLGGSCKVEIMWKL